MQPYMNDLIQPYLGDLIQHPRRTLQVTLDALGGRDPFSKTYTSSKLLPASRL